jgi:hypothetical protein
MHVTWYPKNILAGLALLVALALAINLAVDVRRGVAMGLLAGIAYLIVDVVLSVNPGVWRWRRQPPQA